MAGIIVIFFLNGNKLSSHMAHISEQINSLNNKINYHDKTIKMIVNLGSKKCEYNNNSTSQLNHLQNSLLMSIVDTPEKFVSKVDRKIYKRKVLKS